MNSRTYCVVAGSVFALVALLHLWQVITAAPAVLGGWAVPMGVSWAGLGIAGLLSVLGFRASRQ